MKSTECPALPFNVSLPLPSPHPPVTLPFFSGRYAKTPCLSSSPGGMRSRRQETFLRNCSFLAPRLVKGRTRLCVFAGSCKKAHRGRWAFFGGRVAAEARSQEDGVHNVIGSTMDGVLSSAQAKSGINTTFPEAVPDFAKRIPSAARLSGKRCAIWA